MIKVGINGFGRIGRIAFRVATLFHPSKIEIMAINTSGSMEVDGWAHLLRYDSVYGEFEKKVVTAKVAKEPAIPKESRAAGKSAKIGDFIIDGKRIPVLAERDPSKIPWKKHKVDIVIESTGVFRDRKSASAHLKAGAKKVIISASAKEVETFVIGGNEDEYQGSTIVNMASCTTNCVVPVTKVILENFGIEKAFMSTIHAYTADQEIVDGSHKDLRRARAAAVNIVPTSTGAAIATTEILPDLKGLFDGLAFRVPVICGSVADFTFLVTKRTSVEEVNQAFIKVAKGDYKDIIQVTDQPLVSQDVIGSCASAIIDLALTKVLDHDLVKVVAWYDNEWGYCCRLIEQTIMVGGWRR